MIQELTWYQTQSVNHWIPPGTPANDHLIKLYRKIDESMISSESFPSLVKLQLTYIAAPYWITTSPRKWCSLHVFIGCTTWLAISGWLLTSHLWIIVFGRKNNGLVGFLWCISFMSRHSGTMIQLVVSTCLGTRLGWCLMRTLALAPVLGDNKCCTLNLFLRDPTWKPIIRLEWGNWLSIIQDG